ncbi:AMP-dependent synthetase, partial [Mycobacterium sp. ITM-2017-0098]
AVLASAGLLALGPFMLGFAGDEYRSQGTDLLWLAAAFLPLSAGGAAYEGFARVQRRLALYLSVQALVTAVIIAGSWFGARDLGVA